MSKTRVQLVNKAYNILTGGDSGSGASSNDAAAIDAVIDPVIAVLDAMGAASITDDEAIEDAIFLDLAGLVANAAATEFGSQIDPQKEQYHTNRIRVLARPTPGYGPQQVEYY